MRWSAWVGTKLGTLLKAPIERTANTDSQHIEIREEVGGRDRVRTCDPLLAKQVLSQLSYTPTAATVFNFNAFCGSTVT